MSNKPTVFITQDGSHSINVPELNETYHSSHGAVQESKHVFITNGLYAALPENKLKILEIGFGTGLNAFLTILEAERLKINIVYHSIEKYPLANEIVSQLNYPKILRTGKEKFAKIHTTTWSKSIRISEHFELKKIYNDFKTFETELSYNLIYFDAFAPSKQPNMWSVEVLNKCYNLLNSGGTFVTYSAKGQLKRDLKDIGFKVEVLQGPPGKWEMVRARKM